MSACQYTLISFVYLIFTYFLSANAGSPEQVYDNSCQPIVEVISPNPCTEGAFPAVLPRSLLPASNCLSELKACMIHLLIVYASMIRYACRKGGL
jgi:hypothetical protein